MKIPHRNYFRALSSDGATMAKVIATFFVVVIHSFKLFKFMNVKTSEIYCLDSVRAFVTCSIPIFFLLAGYFLVYKGNWEYKNNLKKKFKSLVIPYLGFVFLYAIVSCVGSLVFPAFFDDFRKFTAYDWLEHLLGIPFLKDPIFYGPLWFVRDLFILNALSFVLVPIVKRTPGYLLIPIMMAIYFAPINRKTYYAFSFFVIGMYFGFKKMIPIFNSKVQIVVVSIVGFVIPMAFEGELAEDISILLLTIFIMAISEKLVKNDKIKRIAQIAIPFSFPVYLLHEYPMTMLTRLLALRHLSIAPAIALFFVLPIPVIFLCVVVAVLWKRVSRKSYVLLTGGRC